MKREIKFRGKHVDNGKWICGWYFLDASGGFDAHYIKEKDDLDDYEVIPETVGQFTGLSDKNGKEIYEGDTLRYSFDDEEKIDVIEFCPPMFTYRSSIRWSLGQDEVVGNIHDNPELTEAT